MSSRNHQIEKTRPGICTGGKHSHQFEPTGLRWRCSMAVDRKDWRTGKMQDKEDVRWLCPECAIRWCKRHNVEVPSDLREE